MTSFLIQNATLPNGQVANVHVVDETIVAVGANVTSADSQVIDASGLVLLPGLVDLHTHLREPGFEQSETILTGSQSAAAGGFTAVHAMANTQSPLVLRASSLPNWAQWQIRWPMCGYSAMTASAFTIQF